MNTETSGVSQQPRSHGGCTTCKIRKIKCDETRPICHRCSSTGRKCDGYETIRSLPLAILDNPQELESYQYFWNKVLPLLPGHYDHLFWGRWVRQACFDEFAIQHAMIAVGALHRSITAKFDKDALAVTHYRPFSIQQYNKAIQYLTADESHRLAPEFVLTSCIIFIMYENLCGRNSQATKHYNNGLAILKSWKPTTISEINVKEEYIIPTYTRRYSNSALPIVPVAFGSLEVARKCLQLVLDFIYGSISADILAGRKNAARATASSAIGILHEWHTKFVELDISAELERQRATILLRLQFQTATILLGSMLVDDESDYDNALAAFETIVDLCEQLAATESILLGTDTAKIEGFVYGFDLSILPPLIIAALKCRDPLVRRRAIALLEAGNRHEGVSNGKTVARIAQKTMEIEEHGLDDVSSCMDIPSSHRLRLVALSYDPGQPSGKEGSEPSPSSRSHYSLTWSRHTHDTQNAGSVRDVLPISAEELSSLWGPGRVPWYMVFHHDSKWSQWKIWVPPQEVLPVEVEPTSSYDVLGGNESGRSSSRTQEDDQPEQLTSLFWDHWRQRRMPLGRSDPVAVRIEQEAARSGRSHSDVQALDDTAAYASHLLIPLP